MPEIKHSRGEETRHDQGGDRDATGDSNVNQLAGYIIYVLQKASSPSTRTSRTIDEKGVRVDRG